MSRSEFGSLYDTSATTLLGFFARRTGDPHTARDLWARDLRPGVRRPAALSRLLAAGAHR